MWLRSTELALLAGGLGGGGGHKHLLHMQMDSAPGSSRAKAFHTLVDSIRVPV